MLGAEIGEHQDDVGTECLKILNYRSVGEQGCETHTVQLAGERQTGLLHECVSYTIGDMGILEQAGTRRVFVR